MSEDPIQIAEKRREAKGKGEKERYTQMNAEFQKTARRDRKAFFSEKWKETDKNNRTGKTRDLFRKTRDTKGTFHASSVQFSRSVVSDSLRPHESQHARPPCSSPTPGVYPDSRPSSQ